MIEKDGIRDPKAYRPSGYPIKHKRKVPFEPKMRLDLDYRSIIGEIRSLDSRLEDFILSADEYLDLIDDAYASNIHWSVRLEGNDLSLEEVKLLTRKFTQGKSGEEKRSGREQEILNHLHSYFAKDIFGLPWDLNTVLAAHRILTKDTGTSMHPGELRKMEVSVTDSEGFEYFIPCPPQHIEGELSSLLEWLRWSPYDEVVTASLFFHEFESIHPFDDGNGRTGRTMLQILLQELGLKNSKLCKFEQELLINPTAYYELLAYTDEKGDYSPFVMHVATSLLTAYRKAVTAFGEKDRLKNTDEISKALALRSKTVKSFTITDAAGWSPSLSEQSVRSRLNVLVDQGILEKVGKTKAMRYRFNDPLRSLKERIETTVGID